MMKRWFFLSFAFLFSLPSCKKPTPGFKPAPVLATQNDSTFSNMQSNASAFIANQISQQLFVGELADILAITSQLNAMILEVDPATTPQPDEITTFLSSFFQSMTTTVNLSTCQGLPIFIGTRISAVQNWLTTLNKRFYCISNADFPLQACWEWTAGSTPSAPNLDENRPFALWQQLANLLQTTVLPGLQTAATQMANDCTTYFAEMPNDMITQQNLETMLRTLTPSTDPNLQGTQNTRPALPVALTTAAAEVWSWQLQLINTAIPAAQTCLTGLTSSCPNGAAQFQECWNEAKNGDPLASITYTNTAVDTHCGK